MNPYLFPLPIGYIRFSDFVSMLEAHEPVYITPLVESGNGSTAAQHIESHYVMVTQADVKGRVHYCRFLVVRLVYHNGLAFALDHAEQISKVEQVRGEIEGQLTGEGYMVRAGMVAFPHGILMVDGNL